MEYFSGMQHSAPWRGMMRSGALIFFPASFTCFQGSWESWSMLRKYPRTHGSEKYPVFFPDGNGGEFREFPLSQSIPFRGLLPPCRAGCIGYALAGRGEIQEFFRFAGCPYLVTARQICVKIQFLRVEFSGKENGGQGVYLLFNKGFK